MNVTRIVTIAAVLTAMCTVPAMSAQEAAKEKGKTSAAKTVTTASGLKYVDVKVGSGASPVKGKQVKVHYTGTLENGKKFDSSVDRNEPFVFVIGVGQVIPGWDEGVMGMKVGGKRKLTIPSQLGYGARGAGGDHPSQCDVAVRRGVAGRTEIRRQSDNITGKLRQAFPRFFFRSTEAPSTFSRCGTICFLRDMTPFSSYRCGSSWGSP